MKKMLYPIMNPYITLEKIVPPAQNFQFAIQGNSYTVNIQGTDADFVIDWGDGSESIAASSSSSRTHIYSTNKEWIITIKNYANGKIRFFNDSKLKKVLTPFPNMGVTSFETWFYLCSQLNEIPNGLFTNNQNVTNINSCFGECYQLSKIPPNLLEGCFDIEIAQGLFYGCLTLKEIPDNLFDNCGKTITFANCFRYCETINAIPNSLFLNCKSATNFEECFRDCKSLLNIPEGLFDNCVEVLDFSMCFRNCQALTGAAPELWNIPTVIDGFMCFAESTGLSNYANIPSGWK